MKKYAELKYAGILLLFCAFFLLPAWAVHAIPVDQSKSSKLTLESECDGQTLVGVVFEIYRVADVKGVYPDMKLAGDFETCPVRLEGTFKDSEWAALALTLKGYAAMDSLTPSYTVSSDEKGKCVITDMKPGLYLVLGKDHTQDDRIYFMTPYLICVPERDSTGYAWDYDVRSQPKFTFKKNSDEPETTNLKVVKVWDDKGYENKRPASITVVLTRDGQDCQTVTLNAANQWMAEWKDLDASHSYAVRETQITGYTVKVTQEGKAFKLTNTYVPNKDTPGKKTTTTQIKLPQTGQDWMPVVWLSCGGLVMLFLSVAVRRNKKHD